ncbi:MAG: Gfo/Idh/MocA family oxidoreductase [Candidatus Hydrogenedentes bacterium]|nr:Gfo/Idh/MocA family oxidoreductase [Candidatus Hydrogenedentota bacterium]
MKSAGAAAGLAMAAGINPFSYAQNDKIRLGIIGTGSQGRIAHMDQGIRKNADQIDVVALCDVFLPNLEEGVKMSGNENIPTYMDYREMLEKEQLDAVLITTPLYLHYQMVLDALDAGLYVFCEKTMAYTIEECRDIVRKCHDTGKFVQVGHQRRYNPYYNKAMWLAHEKNLIGRINHITAQWHRNDSWRRPVPDYALTPEEQKYIPNLEKHVNWRLYNDLSGGLMTELGTHQLDVVSWFLGGLPKRVSGMGGIDYWRDGRECDDNVVLMYEWNVRPGMQGYKPIDQRDAKQNRARINAPYNVRMTYSSICANRLLHYSELIQGDRGSLELVGEQRCQYYAEPWVAQARAAAAAAQAKKEEGENAEGAEGEDAKTTASYIPGEAYNEGVALDVYTDENQSIEYDVWMSNHNSWAGFINDIKTGGMPKANQMTGLLSAICGHKGNEALAKGSTIDIDPALMAFDFETPDAYRYDFIDGPNPGQPVEGAEGAEGAEEGAGEATEEAQA